MDINKKKKYAAAVSIVSNVALTILKLIAGIISGSISIVSEAIHSFSDLFASMLTFFSVLKSSKPADSDHPYGHGKYEDFSGFIEGVLIILAALFIIYQACEKIVLNSYAQTETTLGIMVMLIAVLLNTVVSAMLFRVANESKSVSLYADGEHLRTDVYSSLGVLTGLFLIKITGYYILDPLIAIFVAVYIYRAGYTISKKAVYRLLDFSLSNEDMEKIKYVIDDLSTGVYLKTIKARQVGPTYDIDIVLQFPADTTICNCHKICDEIEQKILRIYSNSTISIHLEPSCYRKNCQDSCPKIAEHSAT